MARSIEWEKPIHARGDGRTVSTGVGGGTVGEGDERKIGVIGDSS